MQKFGLSVAALALALSGCAGNGGGLNVGGLADAGMNAMKVSSLTDQDVKAMSEESCKAYDAKNQIAPATSPYSKRLTKIMTGLKDSGVPVQAKVYLTKDVNAWAMANGCVRVYSGLMDMMSDDEVRGVLGHEIGHVALGHSKSKMQVAWATSAARSALGAAGGTVGALSQSQLGELGEQLVNAQFSQKEESAADDYSFDLLKKNGANREALATSFEKLATLDGGKSSMFSSHPGSKDRANHIRERLKSEK